MAGAPITAGVGDPQSEAITSFHPDDKSTAENFGAMRADDPHPADSPPVFVEQSLPVKSEPVGSGTRGDSL